MAARHLSLLCPDRRRLKVTCCVAVTVGVSVAVLLALLPRLLISRNLKWLLAGAGGVAAVATYASLLSVLNTLTSLLLQAPLALSVSMLLAGLWVWLRRRCLPSYAGSKAPAATMPARQVGLPATPPHRTPQHLAHPDMVAQSPSPGAEHAGGGGEDEAQDVDLTGGARLSPGGGTGAPAQPSSVPPTPSQPQPQGQESSSPPQTEFEALLAMGNVSVHDIQQGGGRRPRSPAREAPPSPGGKVVMAPFTPFPQQGAWGSSDAPASSGVSTIYPPTAARLPPSPGDTPLTRSRHEWSPEPSRAIQWTDLTTSGTFGPGASTDGATGYSGVSASALRGSARRRRRR